MIGVVAGVSESVDPSSDIVLPGVVEVFPGVVSAVFDAAELTSETVPTFVDESLPGVDPGVLEPSEVLPLAEIELSGVVDGLFRSVEDAPTGVDTGVSEPSPEVGLLPGVTDGVFDIVEPASETIPPSVVDELPEFTDDVSELVESGAPGVKVGVLDPASDIIPLSEFDDPGGVDGVLGLVGPGVEDVSEPASEIDLELALELVDGEFVWLELASGVFPSPVAEELSPGIGEVLDSSELVFGMLPLSEAEELPGVANGVFELVEPASEMFPPPGVAVVSVVELVSETSPLGVEGPPGVPLSPGVIAVFVVVELASEATPPGDEEPPGVLLSPGVAAVSVTVEPESEISEPGVEEIPEVLLSPAVAVVLVTELDSEIPLPGVDELPSVMFSPDVVVASVLAELDSDPSLPGVEDGVAVVSLIVELVSEISPPILKEISIEIAGVVAVSVVEVAPEILPPGVEAVAVSLTVEPASEMSLPGVEEPPRVICPPEVVVGLVLVKLDSSEPPPGVERSLGVVVSPCVAGGTVISVEDESAPVSLSGVERLSKLVDVSLGVMGIVSSLLEVESSLDMLLTPGVDWASESVLPSPCVGGVEGVTGVSVTIEPTSERLPPGVDALSEAVVLSPGVAEASPVVLSP